MNKQYTKIAGVRIAYKGSFKTYFRFTIRELLFLGNISGRLPKGGWWIKAKYNA